MKNYHKMIGILQMEIMNQWNKEKNHMFYMMTNKETNPNFNFNNKMIHNLYLPIPIKIMIPQNINQKVHKILSQSIMKMVKHQIIHLKIKKAHLKIPKPKVNKLIIINNKNYLFKIIHPHQLFKNNNLIIEITHYIYHNNNKTHLELSKLKSHLIHQTHQKTLKHNLMLL